MTMTSTGGNNSAPSNTTNVVQLCGSSTGPCGYCNGSRASIVGKSAPHSSSCYGLLIPKMTPSHYESLINKGWRRSGIHLYKPDNWHSCCPALTIRLQTTRFQPSKAQQKVIQKLERSLTGQSSGNVDKKPKKKSKRQASIQVDPNVLHDLQTATFQCLKRILNSSNEEHHQLSPLQPEVCRFKVKKSTSTKNKDTASTTTLATTACAALAGRSKGALQRDALSRSLAAALEQEALESVHSVTAHEPSGQVIVTLSNDAVVTSVPPSDDTGDAMSLSPVNPIQEWLQTTKEPPYKLTVTTVEAHESSLQPEVHKLYFQYQQAVHGDANPLLNDDMDSEENEEDWGEASEEYIASCKRMLAQEYGNHDESDAVENMNAAFSGFYRFLVETPIQYDGTYGTVHQHYRIDGKLIAIGVVDLLPHGLSSVYAIYDPAQHVTAFGKYLSLREIQYTSPQYYYLGYYIESCPKMRYKAEYQPSELLCPTTEKWVDAQQAQETLLQDSPERHCCTLYKSNDEKEMNGNKRPNARVSREVLNQVRLDVGTSSLVTLNMLHSGGQAVVRPLVEEFVKEMGPDMAREFIIKLV